MEYSYWSGTLLLVKRVPSIRRRIPLLAVASPPPKYGWKFGNVVNGVLTAPLVMTVWNFLLVVYHQISISASFDFPNSHNQGSSQNPVNHVTLSRTSLSLKDSVSNLFAMTAWAVLQSPKT